MLNIFSLLLLQASGLDALCIICLAITTYQVRCQMPYHTMFFKPLNNPEMRRLTPKEKTWAGLGHLLAKTKKELNQFTWHQDPDVREYRAEQRTSHLCLNWLLEIGLDLEVSLRCFGVHLGPSYGSGVIPCISVFHEDDQRRGEGAQDG